MIEFIVWCFAIGGAWRIIQFFGTLKIGKLLFGLMLCYAASYMHDKNKVYHYKVKELANNTVFEIVDPKKLDESDTVWVNATTYKVDPADSVAMKCVIIKKQ